MTSPFGAYDNDIDDDGGLFSRLRRFVRRSGVIDPAQGLTAVMRVEAMLPPRPVEQHLAERYSQAPSTRPGPPGTGIIGTATVPIVHRLPAPPPSAVSDVGMDPVATVYASDTAGPRLTPVSPLPVVAPSPSGPPTGTDPGPQLAPQPAPPRPRPVVVGRAVTPGPVTPGSGARPAPDPALRGPASVDVHVDPGRAVVPLVRPRPAVAGGYVEPGRDPVGPGPLRPGVDGIDEGRSGGDIDHTRSRGDDGHQVPLSQMYETRLDPAPIVSQPVTPVRPAVRRPADLVAHPADGSPITARPAPGNLPVVAADTEPDVEISPVARASSDFSPGGGQPGPGDLPHPLARGQYFWPSGDDGPGRPGPAAARPAARPAIRPPAPSEAELADLLDVDDDGDEQYEPAEADEPAVDRGDLERIVDRVQRQLARRLEVERERRGETRWR